MVDSRPLRRLRPSEVRPGRLVATPAGCGRHETPGTWRFRREEVTGREELRTSVTVLPEGEARSMVSSHLSSPCGDKCELTGGTSEEHGRKSGLPAISVTRRGIGDGSVALPWAFLHSPHPRPSRPRPHPAGVVDERAASLSSGASFPCRVPSPSVSPTGRAPSPGASPTRPHPSLRPSAGGGLSGSAL
jgi:hypothetical protein